MASVDALGAKANSKGPPLMVCHRVYYEHWGSPYERNEWRKIQRKRPEFVEPKHVYLAPPDKIQDNNIVKINLTHGTWEFMTQQGISLIQEIFQAEKATAQISENLAKPLWVLSRFMTREALSANQKFSPSVKVEPPCLSLV